MYFDTSFLGKKLISANHWYETKLISKENGDLRLLLVEYKLKWQIQPSYKIVLKRSIIISIIFQNTKTNLNTENIQKYWTDNIWYWYIVFWKKALWNL